MLSRAGSLPAGHGERVEISAFLAVPACETIKKVFSRGDFGGSRVQKGVSPLWLLKLNAPWSRPLKFLLARLRRAASYVRALSPDEAKRTLREPAGEKMGVVSVGTLTT